jgi:Delta7-sterol 5-desaturase
MDVVLEIFDTFLLDRVYASLYPATSSKLSDLAYNYGANSSTPQILPPIKPATKYIQLQPSQYAYMSEWSRDNVLRQGISLYLITW